MSAIDRIRSRRSHILAVGGETSIERSAIIELADRVEALEQELAAQKKEPAQGGLSPVAQRPSSEGQS